MVATSVLDNNVWDSFIHGYFYKLANSDTNTSPHDKEIHN